MRARHLVPLAFAGLLLVGAVAYSQGYQPDFIRNLVGPITITGNLTSTGNATFSGDVTADHYHSTAAGTENGYNMAQDVHLVFNDPTSTVYMDYNGTSLEVAGAPLSTGANNITTTGSVLGATVQANVLDGGTVVATGPLTVSGQTGLQGVTAGLTRVLQLDAGNVTVVTPGKICTDVPCATNYLQNDGFGTLNIAGPVSGTNNIAAVGTITASDYFIASTGLKNTGTAAACSSNTGAVCVNDTGGLAVADGSGTTVATISAAGAAGLTSMKLSILATPTCNSSTEATLVWNTGSGGTSGHETHLCYCTSDGAGSPNYAWYNLVHGTKGDATTCPD